MLPRASAPAIDQRLPGVYRPRFLARHLWFPLFAAAVAGSLLMQGGGDAWLADRLLQLEGGRWALRDAWATSVLIHKGGKWLSTAGAFAALALCLLPVWRRGDQRLRWALLYLGLAVGLGTGVVSLLKGATNMDCPWDLLRYGGDRPFIGLLQHRPATLPPGACFPAGHASAGYAWTSLYFFALLWRPAWRHVGLAVGLAAGLVFGIAQQLRGAHFLSHDVFSLLTCWLVAFGLFILFHGNAPTRAENAQEPRP